ncbi:MAG: hypothetical protein WDN31_02930 [Hyphomicrobium sp.]
MSERRQYTADEASSEQQEPERDYLEVTRTFWQPYAGRELTREDAREMAHNLLGYFAVLREWSIRARERARNGLVTTTVPPPPRKRGRPRKIAERV